VVFGASKLQPFNAMFCMPGLQTCIMLPLPLSDLLIPSADLA